MRDIEKLTPAISSILARHTEEQDAAPDLRKLAIKHHQRRYRVFAAYRLLKQQRETRGHGRENMTEICDRLRIPPPARC